MNIDLGAKEQHNGISLMMNNEEDASFRMKEDENPLTLKTFKSNLPEKKELQKDHACGICY